MFEDGNVRAERREKTKRHLLQISFPALHLNGEVHIPDTRCASATFHDGAGVAVVLRRHPRCMIKSVGGRVVYANVYVSAVQHQVTLRQTKTLQ
jgi:hypothetical protein